VLMAWLQLSGSRLDAVEEPERALALIVGRTMDIDEAVAHAPAWEQFVYRVLSSDPSEDVEEGLRWYEELARESAHPSIDLHLAILEGEAERTDPVRRRTGAGARRAAGGVRAARQRRVSRRGREGRSPAQRRRRARRGARAGLVPGPARDAPGHARRRPGSPDGSDRRAGRALEPAARAHARDPG